MYTCILIFLDCNCWAQNSDLGLYRPNLMGLVDRGSGLLGRVQRLFDLGSGPNMELDQSKPWTRTQVGKLGSKNGHPNIEYEIEDPYISVWKYVGA